MIIDIKNITNKEYIGGKAFNLNILQKEGFQVPKGFVITTQFYEKYKSNCDWDFSEIVKKFSQTFSKNEKVIVRSSANFEDSKEHSFAGVFESYPDINIDNITENIIKIYNSIYSDKALTYYKNNNIDKNKVSMSIIVQEQIEPYISGVCFTKNPLNSKDQIIIEYVKGSNADFVSGKSSPITLEFENKNLLTKIEVNDEIILLQQFLEQFILIEKIFNNPQDIEWAIDKNKKLFILQSRDITSNINNPQIKIDNLDNKIIDHGVGISIGVSSGKINFINTDLKFEELKNSISNKDIIVTHNIRVDQIMAIKNASGIILSESSILSHVAIQAREFKIPCIGGIHDFAKLSQNKIVTIDGSSGIIFDGEIDIGNSGNFDNSNYQNFPNYYDLDLIKEYKLPSFTFLYCIKGNFAMIYLPNIEKSDQVREAKEILINNFGIPESNIILNKNRIYPKSGMTYVYSYYKDYSDFINNDEYQETIKNIHSSLENLNLSDFSKIVEKERAKAHAIYVKGYELFLKFKDSKDTKILEEAAIYLDNSLKITIFVNNVTLLILGTYYLNKLLEKYKGPKLAEFLQIANFENEPLQKIKELSILLENYKNTEMEALTEEEVSFIDILDYIYENGYEESVLKYNW